MVGEMNAAKHVVHDQLASQIRAAAASLDALKARAEAVEASLEIAAIAELLGAKPTITRGLHQLTQSTDEHWVPAKREVEATVAYFEKSVKAIESRLKGG
jgi:hypothetical protein